MATIGSLIDNIRVFIRDKDESRWQTEDLLVLGGSAIENINHELYQQGITFARSSATFTTASGTYQYGLSSDLSVTDFMMWDSLWDTDDDDQLIHMTDETWEDVSSVAEAGYWRLNGTNIEIRGTPSSAINMRFYYWPEIDTSSYTRSTSAPWSDRCNRIIEEYVTARALHRDEMMSSGSAVFAYNVSQAVYRTFAHYGGSKPMVEGWL